MPSEYSRKWTDKLPPWLIKLAFFLYPPYLGTGFRLKTFRSDYRLVEVELKLRWYNANIFGTHFGGSMYAMIDPFYAVMVWRNLGGEYLVWDHSGAIEYKKPGRGVLRARFELNEEALQQIRDEVARNDRYLFERQIDIFDESGEVIAVAFKTIFIGKKKSAL